jgi:hypothetical protein
MEESITEVKGWREKVECWQKTITEKLQHMVTGKSAWAFFIVFLTICLAVVGFLWRGQVTLWEKTAIDHKETVDLLKAGTEKIAILDKKMDLIDYKVELHLKETEKEKKK